MQVNGIAGRERITAELLLLNGNDTAEKIQPAVYLSSDPVRHSSDMLLWSRAVPALDPGESMANKFRVTLPGGMATKGKYLVAETKPQGVLNAGGTTTVAYGPLP